VTANREQATVVVLPGDLRRRSRNRDALDLLDWAWEKGKVMVEGKGWFEKCLQENKQVRPSAWIRYSAAREDDEG
jgi:hypothetical protein